MAALLLVACTRDRPAAEPTATLPAAPIQATQSGAEPGVTVEAPTTQDNQDNSLPEVTATVADPAQAQPEAPAVVDAVPTPSTLDYRVQAGETMASIANKFGTDIDTLRRLNYLSDDTIFAGQILRIPQGEGITVEGVSTPTPAPYRYTVQAGDTLGSIAQNFGVPAVRIVEVNNLLNPDNLLVGGELIIPDYQPTAAEAPQEGNAGVDTSADPAAGASVVHIVQPGQGLLQIAAQYGIDEAALAAANGITNRNLLRVGQQLVIPGVSAQEAAAARGQLYVVQSGESLASIAVRYGVTVQELVALNNLANPDAIYVGQELIVPEQ